MIDIIRFKNINYISGHEVGDKILINIANKLKTIFINDLVFRTNSDEFVILMQFDSCDNEHLKKISRKISEHITNIIIDGKSYKIAVAIGCAYSNSSYDSLLKNSEYACKIAKEEYSEAENYKLYDDYISKKVLRIANIESLLKNINYDEEFHLEYQPQFTVDGRELIGMEALLRWKSPTIGNVAPSEFIPIAENTGTISNITRWTLQESFKLIKEINSKFNSNLVMSVNISPKYFNSYNFIKEIEYYISKYDINAKWLDFEITEMTVMNFEKNTSDTFKRLHKLGITISLDDFGTGYSSLSYIQNLNIDKLKIAKELIDLISINSKKSKVVQAIVMMANELNLKTIAEGVENKIQKDILQEIGCGQIQGFYYGRPVKYEEFERNYLLNKNLKLHDNFKNTKN